MDIEEILDIKFVDDHYDELFQYIGWFGKYSVRIFVLILTLITIGAMHIVSPVYTAASPDTTCNITSAFMSDISEVSHRFSMY